MDNETKTNESFESLSKRALEDVINNSLGDILKEKLSQSLSSMIDDLLRWGDVHSLIESKLKSVMVESIEKWDMSEYVDKLDILLADIVKESALPSHGKLLNNFRSIMKKPDLAESGIIPVEDIWVFYQTFISKEFDCTGRDIIEGHYDLIPVEVYAERVEVKYSHYFEYMDLRFFIGEEDLEGDNANLDYTIRLSRYIYSRNATNDIWEISLDYNPTIKGLCNMSDFEAFLCSLDRSGIQVRLKDGYSDSEFVASESEPEVHLE